MTSRRRGGRISIALGLAALALGAVALAVWRRPEPRDPDAYAIRQALLAEIRPVALRNCTLTRVGSAHDGGYLLCGNLVSGVESAYSYGVGPNDEFGCDLSTRAGVPVHQYDCFDPARPACASGTFVFHDECIGPREEMIEGRSFRTLAAQIAANGDAGKRLIVKIDVEGAEWDALMETPDAILARIDQMPMELHIDPSAEDAAARLWLDVVRKLKRNFYVVNLNFNNWACSPETAPLPSRAFQVLLVNRRLGVIDEAAGAPPRSPLNAPDNPAQPDCQVEF